MTGFDDGNGFELTAPTFIKTYLTNVARSAAQAHLRWLAFHASPLRPPRIVAARARRLVFEGVEGRRPVLADLAAVASHLGAAHGTAWTTRLHAARLDTSYRLDSGHVIAGFTAGWLEMLDILERSGRLDGGEAASYRSALGEVADGPVAISTNTTPDSLLISPAGRPVSIDFDHLILAPFGYDLARLIVTLALQHGPVPKSAAQQAMNAYNPAARRHGSHLGVNAAQMIECICLHRTLIEEADGDLECWPEPRRTRPPHTDGAHRNPPKDPLDHVPEAVTYARVRAGLTKTRLAEECGVSVSLISEIESGTRNAHPLMIGKLANALNCPPVILERKHQPPS
jgi:DNA-binding XRE family transcriptional regulator